MRFLNKQRRILATENRADGEQVRPSNSADRFLKYSRYAIGEIILVVIGILIALQVNNWNQDMKDHRLGNDYLLRIHSDLVQDTLNFRNNIIRNNELREEIKWFLFTMYDGIDNIEEVQKMSTIHDKAMDQVFTVNDNTYSGMISSGSLGLIHNQQLKEDILSLYSEYDQKKALLSGIGQWMITIATTESIQTNFIKFNKDVSDIFTTDEMMNETDYSYMNDKDDPRFKLLVRAISATAFNQKASNAYYLELIGKCEIVLRKIEEELE